MRPRGERLVGLQLRSQADQAEGMTNGAVTRDTWADVAREQSGRICHSRLRDSAIDVVDWSASIEDVQVLDL